MSDSRPILCHCCNQEFLPDFFGLAFNFFLAFSISVGIDGGSAFLFAYETHEVRRQSGGSATYAKALELSICLTVVQNFL